MIWREHRSIQLCFAYEQIIDPCIWCRLPRCGQTPLYRDNQTARSIFKRVVAFAFFQENKAIQAREV
ncbi:hypothetical protein HZS_3713 [Henneguya salminicola]|nr:hypothetical protein HZS_3713 [Henneguya salminicola]